MARPQKDGMDYFPHDVYASSDEKVEPLLFLYGAAGYAFYFMHLEYIYRTKDFEFDISDAETIQILCSKLRICEEDYQKILNTALKHGLFDKKHFEETKCLTSDGIKKRAKPVIDKRDKMRQQYENKQEIISDAETPPETHIGKESKVKERKGKDISPNGDLSPNDGDGNDSEGSTDPKPENNGKKSIPPCPHKEIISAYHSALPGCPQIRVWDETSKKNLQARWKEDESRRDVSWWAEKFQEVAESDFLMGRLNSNGGSPFMFSLGWFVKPSNFAKVLNGNYANRGQPVAMKQIPCPTCQFSNSPICAKKPDEKRIACPSFREKAA